MPQRIVLLNGTSSAGKTTVARALQRTLQPRWLCFGVDQFIEMLTDATPGSAPEPDGHDVGRWLAEGWYGVIGGIAASGFDVIVDDVIVEPHRLEAAIRLLAPLDVTFVAVRCPLEVVVPGAGGEVWYWHSVVVELRARGHEGVAVALPAGDDGAGWAEYADAIVGAVGERTGSILVAQSLAGFSAPIACERAPVELLVLLNAMIPLPGETGEAWWSNTGQREAQLEYLAAIGVTPEEARDDRVVYFHDVPGDVLAEAERRGEPEQSWTPMEQAWPLDAWPRTPTRVLAGRDDRLFPAAFQSRVARDRLGLQAETIPGGHLVALSDPRGLVDRLLDDPRV